jgi:hypothetical protein
MWEFTTHIIHDGTNWRRKFCPFFVAVFLLVAVHENILAPF